MTPRRDPVTEYAQAVHEGRIVAGHLVRLACERHLRDLIEGPARALRWDPDAVELALGFFRLLCLPADGQLDGKPFEPEPFQVFILGSLVGWKGPDGYRRFRTAYVEQGKGNGKTPLAAALGLYGLIMDGEAAAEIYPAATTREQASILFRDARRMAEASPSLAKRLVIGQANIAFPKTDSFLRPVSAEHRGLDGKRPHMALIDELHEHPSAMVTDKMRAGTKSRRQALVFEITNSGHNRHSVCWAHREYSRKILEGKLRDDSWFAYVCTLDPCAHHKEEGKGQPVDGCPDCDDYRDERVWPKVNPGLDTILPRKYLREQVTEAQGMPSKAGIVQRLNFCIWTEQITSWLPAELWGKGNAAVDAEQLKGKVCSAGLDLANRFDVNALILAFRQDIEATPEEQAIPELERHHRGRPKTSAVYRLLPFFWIPREVADEREKTDKVPYSLWERQGLIRFTQGDVTDYEAIKEFIQSLTESYFIEKLFYDPYNATQMALQLQAFGVTVKEFTQNTRNFNEPSKELEALLKAGRLYHGAHPVLAWMAGNAAKFEDAHGNIRPVKPEGQETAKIDGIVAAIMALSGAMVSAGGSVPVVEWI